MKKIVAFLTAVLVLTGSMGAVASADDNLCIHPYDKVQVNGGNIYVGTTTHPLWVGNKPNGEPILVNCTVTYRWKKIETVCMLCGQVLSTKTDPISETHSIHH